VRNDKKLKPDSKKGFPGGFFIFLLAAILIIMTMQSLSSGKMANVSFSHQLEHLINLDMIRPEDSRMTAHNNNLVLFPVNSSKHYQKIAKIVIGIFSCLTNKIY